MTSGVFENVILGNRNGEQLGSADFLHCSFFQDGLQHGEISKRI